MKRQKNDFAKGFVLGSIFILTLPLFVRMVKEFGENDKPIRNKKRVKA